MRATTRPYLRGKQGKLIRCIQHASPTRNRNSGHGRRFPNIPLSIRGRRIYRCRQMHSVQMVQRRHRPAQNQDWSPSPLSQIKHSGVAPFTGGPPMPRTIIIGVAPALASGTVAGRAYRRSRAACPNHHRKPVYGGFPVTPPPTTAFRVVRRGTTA